MILCCVITYPVVHILCVLVLQNISNDAFFFIDLNNKGFSMLPECHNSKQNATIKPDCFTYDEALIEPFKIKNQAQPSPSLNKTNKFQPTDVALAHFDLIDNLAELLQQQFSNPNKIIDVLSNISASHAGAFSCFTNEFIENLRKCGSTASVLRMLVPYTNWCDHSIFRVLVEAFDCPEGVKLLDEFDSQVDATYPVTEYPILAPSLNLFTPTVSSGHTVMAVQCKEQWSSLSLQQLGVVKSVLMSTFDINDYACVFLAGGNHTSAMLYWLVPKSIVLPIADAVQKHFSVLYDNGLIEVAIYPNFSFTTGGVSRLWKSHYFTDIATVSEDVSDFYCLCTII